MISCQDCNFFVPNQWSRLDSVADGECRRLPPVASSLRGGQRQLAKFPSVSKDDWCAEFVKWPAPLGQRREDDANAANQPPWLKDATAANVGAVAGQCQSGGH